MAKRGAAGTKKRISTAGTGSKQKPAPLVAKKKAKNSDWSNIKLTVPFSISIASRRAIRFKNGG